MSSNTNILVHGTPNEVRKAGGDLKRVPSCCAPKAGVVRGCRFYHGVNAVEGDPDTPFLECPLKKFRDKDWRGMGPLNVGVVEAKKVYDARGNRSRKPIAKTLTCYHVPERNAFLRQNHGGLRVVAMEGEKFKVPGSVKEPTGDVTNPWVVKDTMIEIVVPKFPRPGESPNMVDDSIAAEIVRDAMAEEAARSMTFEEVEMEGDVESVLDDAAGASPLG